MTGSKTVLQYPTANRTEWLGLRKRDVTGSEAGALLGVHAHITPLELYARKTGAVVDDIEISGPVSRGMRLESYVADAVREKGEFVVSKELHYYRDPRIRLGGTPDFKIIRCEYDGKPQGVLEIKTVGQRDFVEKWRGGDKDGKIIPPAWMLVQMQVYLYLTDAEYGRWGVLPVGDWEPMDVVMVEAERRSDVISRILTETAKFWENVENRVMPTPDFEKDSAVIKAIYADTKVDKTIDLRYDTEIEKLLAMHAEHNAKKLAAEKSVKWISAAILSKFGDAESAIVPGFHHVTYKKHSRSGYTVAPTSYRQLNYKRSDPL